MSLRNSRLWQDSLAHATIFEGDALECGKWLGWAKQKLQFMLHSIPGASSQLHVPADGVVIRIDTRPNRISIAAGGIPDVILFLAGQDFPTGWGKPYTSFMGTPGGNNPWTLLSPTMQSSFPKITKALPITHFTDKDDVTYSTEPNTENCFWGNDPSTRISWKGPYNQYGPVILDNTAAAGGLLSDMAWPDGYAGVSGTYPYIVPQFGKKVFQKGKVLVEFDRYVLAACLVTTPNQGVGVVAYTTNSLHLRAGLHNYIEVVWLNAPGAPAQILDIDMVAHGTAISRTIAPNTCCGSFDLTGTKLMVPLEKDTTNRFNYGGGADVIEILRVTLTIDPILSAGTPTFSAVPYPTERTTKMLLAPSAGAEATSIKTNCSMLSCGYYYPTNQESFLFLINERYSDAGLVHTASYLLDHRGAQLLTGRGIAQYSFSSGTAQSLYGDAPFGAEWYVAGTDSTGLFAYSPLVVDYCAQYARQAVIFGAAAEFGVDVPVGFLWPYRESLHLFTGRILDAFRVDALTYDDAFTNGDVVLNYTASLGHGNLTSATVFDSINEATWVTFSGTIDNIDVSGNHYLVANMVEPTPTTTNNINQFDYRYYSADRIMARGVSGNREIVAGVSVKGPFAYRRQAEYSTPPTDLTPVTLMTSMATKTNSFNIDMVNLHNPPVIITSLLVEAAIVRPYFKDARLY